ncbi:MAG: YafY family protein [Nitrobacter sp.]
MRRADRLFQIVLTIGRKRMVTGKCLAEALGVATRTVYRDIADLVRSGVPIEGEAGVGYRLGRGYHVPPLMFTDEELQALHLGVSIVRSWTDAGLAKAAEQVLAKVDAVLPAAIRPKLAYGAMIVPGGHVPKVIADHLSTLRRVIGERRKVIFDYPRPFAENTRRTVRPLVLVYWGGSWTLGAWCEAVDEFRTFRIDGMLNLDVSNQTFPDQQGRCLSDYLAAAPNHRAVLGAAVDALKAGEAQWPAAPASR